MKTLGAVEQLAIRFSSGYSFLWDLNIIALGEFRGTLLLLVIALIVAIALLAHFMYS